MAATTSAASLEMSFMRVETPSATKKSMKMTQGASGMAMPSFSLELLSRKRGILESEVHKLEACLHQRTKLLCQLRQTHEALITSNAKLEERARLRDAKVDALRTALEATGNLPERSKGSKAVDVDDLAAAGEKLRLCEALLVSFEKQRAFQETACMEKEEQLQRSYSDFEAASVAFGQARETQHMMQEDANAVVVALQRELAAARAAEDSLSRASQCFESEKLASERIQKQLDKIDSSLVDRRVAAVNSPEMHAEDTRGLNERMMIAEGELRHVEELLRKSGAAIPEDFEVEERAHLLTQKLEELAATIARAKFGKRDAFLRRKEEVALLSVAKANVAAREDQLKWLERQLAHLQMEHEALVVARDADERAYNAFKQGFEEQMRSISQHNAVMEKEAADVSQLIATARDRAVLAKRELAASSTELQSVRAFHTKMMQDTDAVRGEVARVQEDCADISAALGVIHSTNRDMISTNDRLEMALEDELSHQLRIAEAMSLAKEEASTAATAAFDVAISTTAKLQSLGFDQSFDLDNEHQLLQAITNQSKQASAVETARFEQLVEEATATREKMEDRYRNLVDSVQARYQEEIDAKRDQHNDLVAKLGAKKARDEAEWQAQRAVAQAHAELPAQQAIAREKAEAERVAKQAEDDEEMRLAISKKVEAGLEASRDASHKLVPDQLQNPAPKASSGTSSQTVNAVQMKPPASKPKKSRATAKITKGAATKITKRRKQSDLAELSQLVTAATKSAQEEPSRRPKSPHTVQVERPPLSKIPVSNPLTEIVANVEAQPTEPEPSGHKTPPPSLLSPDSRKDRDPAKTLHRKSREKRQEAPGVAYIPPQPKQKGARPQMLSAPSTQNHQKTPRVSKAAASTKSKAVSSGKVSTGHLETASQRKVISRDASQSTQSAAKISKPATKPATKPVAKPPQKPARQAKPAKTKSRMASQSVDWYDNDGFSFS